ncbi:cobalt ECF transporter T component CbiQ [Candidatus Planktophila versatilis]|uniref:Cobalt/nickel transport system permease protein n=1 Tax=Candidatus Planktophila versatilis TaxID=1884905 RepID=A0ABN5BER9_9ACTN|nr:cobalt ECF transporter T component CbiQ [Candidatus Planktophila versatilis]ASY17764.1 cobalt/nickel transport system permease protein [Candidatus Planktophila versatilis]
MAHSLPSHLKIIAVLLFVLVVVSTPITYWPAFVIFLALVIAAATAGKISIFTLSKRALIEVPFIFFAVLMPFFGTGERFELGPFNLYREGLLAGLSIVAKGTLGVLSAVILSTTTTAREILRGLERLRLPTIMVQIASFMLRYVNVISDEMERMKIARQSRGFDATGVKHWKVIATSAAALFIRSYERGERVHLAMLSRGFDGELPHTEVKSVGARAWLTALTIPTFALITSIFVRMIG